MTTTASVSTVPMQRRGGRSMQGVSRIVRFNWPLYVAGVGGAVVPVALAFSLPVAPGTRALLFGSAAAAAFWIVASLIASWMVYDRSGLMTGEWIALAIGVAPRSWVAIHAGFDEITPALTGLFVGVHGRTLDIYDPARMTESSLARARNVAVGARSEPANYARLPIASGSVDAVVLALSAHELRTHAARRTLFREVRRVLTPRGRVVVAEHLRDVANFAAFGPGVLHFHSRRSWLRCFEEAGLAVEREAAITPFVRTFVLARF